MNERFREGMADVEVRADTKLLGDFTARYCRGNHRERARTPLASDAVTLGVYGRKVPELCEECAAHLRYGEARRAYCPKDPKPFCAHCDTHCYKSDESAWQRQMMRYSGPRSVLHGYAIEGMKHALEARRWRRTVAASTEKGPNMSTITTRQIVRIDEELCTGCGLCVSPCAEGAIQVVGGKARVIREELCDGAGFCLGVCPTGALTIEVRETMPFDHEAAAPIIAEKQQTYIPQGCFRCGTDEDHAPLLPVRQQGRSEWVCTRCLPALIHG